ncbi:MAG: hypothetical protein KFF73_05240 [Cyclobacteriaceae bacterium]|nr:hypothetical protein [Cyclobacteriaceae bacterium]
MRGKYWKKFLAGVLVILLVLVAFSYLRTMNKTELEFRIRINRELVLLSAYGEPPTFAIWVENSQGDYTNVYVTHRAFNDDWEGKPDVPVALPFWSYINTSNKSSGEQEKGIGTDAVSGATPREDLFIIRLRVSTQTTYQCWIEMNLAGDYNEFYRENDPVKMISDEFGNGQPALVYQGIIEIEPGNKISPGLFGMSIKPCGTEDPVRPVEGITTAKQVFSQIEVEVVRPKPYLIKPDR